MPWPIRKIFAYLLRRDREKVARAVAAVQPLVSNVAHHNVLAVSDLHLGADLRGGDSPERPRTVSAIDRQLAAFLDHHRDERPQGLPWRLVLNGDIIDFVAITLRPAPGEAVSFTLSDEDIVYGLAADEAKTVWKLHKVFERHDVVMTALARFVAAGHSLVFVRGNHDAEVRFEAVQRTFKDLLADRAYPAPGPKREEFSARIEFYDWFYLDPAGLYMEHGHVYDEWSTTDDMLAPRPVRDMQLPISSQAMRYFSNHYLGLDHQFDAETMGLFDFVRLTIRVGNPLAVLRAYLIMVGRVLGPTIRASVRISRRAVVAAGNAFVDGVDPAAERFRLLRAQLDRLAGTPERGATEELLRLLKRPANGSLFDLLQLFYLDQFALVSASAAAATVLLLTHMPLSAKATSLSAVGLAFAGVCALLGSRRDTESHPKLRAAAGRIAQLFRVRYVVMGHSHRAVSETIPETSARYFNLGSWTDAHRDGPLVDGLPHLRVAGGVAELVRWRG